MTARSFLRERGWQKDTTGFCIYHLSPGDDNVHKFDSCSPLHENNAYKPQGEIITATDPSKGSLYRDTGDIHKEPKTNFYVCRGDYQGTEVENSKVVKVQVVSGGGGPLGGPTTYEWEYYRCNQVGDWVEAECEPGQEIRVRTGNDLQCVSKSPQTVEATFFNMSSVPKAIAGDERVVGMKFEAAEIIKYENLMEKELQNIDAECWMGDDNKRPNDESKAGTFRLNYDGAGDAWALGKITYRDQPTINNNTYSCIWGFSEKPEYSSPSLGNILLDEGIYESTREEPLQSVDGGRIDINYTETIFPEYNDLGVNLDESVDRSDLWTPYSSDDTRSYVDNTDESMFDFPNAFPYCTEPSSPNSILDNIICS